MTSSDDTTIYHTAKEHGEEGKDVPIKVSFRIIKQFSEELYDNPRRAIEELVCNSYDAGANECHVVTPEEGEDALKVLDNGESMDVEGLEWLWKVAESRKAETLDDDRVKHDRKQIGKFGVGKLASFALGSRLTHVATVDGKTRVISVHQADLKEDRKDSATIREFDSDEAEEVLGQYFEDIPNPWERGWDRWTLAVVNDIPSGNKGKELGAWHLKRMIPAAIPSQTDFVTNLNGEEVERKEPPADVKFSVDVTEDEFIEVAQDGLKRFWSDEMEVEPSEVPEEKYNIERDVFESPGNTEEEIAGISVPNLGPVSGSAEFYDQKLTTTKREERGFEEHGFRVFVRGRLVNKNDIDFGLDNLSHKTWVRFRSELEIPALDEDLRVQRDSTKDSVEVGIAKVVVRSTFNLVRKKAREIWESEDADDEEEEPMDLPFSDRLQMRSPWYGSHAVAGLAMEEGVEVEMDDVELRISSLRSTDNAVEFDAESSAIIINDQHPLFDTLDRKSSFTKHLENAFSEILAARLLIHGYLNFHGADSDAMAASRQIFDSVLRSAAGTLGEDELKYQKRELKAASIEGDTRFEKTIADIFQNIGLAAAQEGGPDTHDGVIEIPRTAEPNFEVSVEAKGSQGVVDHNQLSFDDVNRHRTEEECDHAIVVGREFQTDGRGDKRSALLRNADEEINEEIAQKISFMTTEALEVFLQLHYEQPFTYSETKKVLTNKMDPGDIREYVIEVWEDKPDDQLTIKILEAAHEFMTEDATNPPAMGTLTAHEKLRGVDRGLIAEKLEALDSLVDSVTYNEEGNLTVEIDGSPETVIQEVDEAEANATPILESAEE